MSMLYRPSYLAVRAVFLSGLVDVAESNKVRRFHAATLSSLGVLNHA